MEYAIQDVGYHWLVERIAQKAVTPLRYKDNSRVRDFLAKNSGPGVVLLQAWLYDGGDDVDWIYSVQGIVYGVNFSRLAETRPAHDLFVFSRQNLALCVGHWFYSHGYMSAQGWGAYTERVYAPR